MANRPDIERWTARLAAVGIETPVRAVRDRSGGCIHDVVELTLADDRRLIAKTNAPSHADAFEAERLGLDALAGTRTVRVPRVEGVACTGRVSRIIMEALADAPATSDSWVAFGRQLARLHATEHGHRYGFEIDNHLGTTPQPNPWMEDWIEFNRRARLGYQIDMGETHGRLEASESRRLRSLMERLDKFLPPRPHPALLHGDLWSGNVLATRDVAGDAEIAVIDPACSIGDGWADIAMLRLFGGVPEACFDAYAAEATDHDRVPMRLAVYQLYHLLNHVNLFGRGYIGGVMQQVEALGG